MRTSLFLIRSVFRDLWNRPPEDTRQNEQSQYDGLQNAHTRPLRHQPRHRRKHCAPGLRKHKNDTQRCGPNLPREELAGNTDADGDKRPGEEAHEAQRGGGADDVGDQPEDEVEGDDKDKGEEDHAVLAEAVDGFREEDAAEKDAEVVACRDEAHV